MMTTISIWYFSWFRFGTHPATEKEDWLYTGKYWDREWSQTPNIF